LLKELE